MTYRRWFEKPFTLVYDEFLFSNSNKRRKESEFLWDKVNSGKWISCWNEICVASSKNLYMFIFERSES